MSAYRGMGPCVPVERAETNVPIWRRSRALRLARVPAGTIVLKWTVVLLLWLCEGANDSRDYTFRCVWAGTWTVGMAAAYLIILWDKNTWK